ncbi:hypothetical protein VMCG_08098 [Cytospora schulzeri]|uniref:Uncharacterized protein n=1 Tax=Cytospora schulzeri TaxID=448051 RepID=A0A423VRB3_9PEZI|nr:hypothetical protein VMCG_08098 [Valsa malicola]
MSVREQLPPLIITFLVVDIIAVGLRVWIRTHVKKSFGYDDCALCIALVGFILLAILAFICLNYGYGSSEILPGYNVILAAKLLPVYLLKGIQISRKLKVSVMILLGLGVV